MLNKEVYILLGDINKYMNKSNNKIISPSIISVDNIFKFFNKSGKVYYDINSPYELFLELKKYCPSDIEMVLIDPNQLKSLREDDYTRNGTDPIEIDGLCGVRTQKYIKKFSNYSITEVT